MHHRGRSRVVSPVALARRASEERRLPRPDPDPDPDPPLSLEDQIQVAYALDDIRTAKILLLRLKGVHVADDSDPRIDHVRDEDFDMCFAPAGPLTLDDADRRALQETQRRQQQCRHETQRARRLKACEKLWEDEKNRLHQERARALQRREQLALEQERARLAEKQRHTRSRLETPLPKRDQDPFQYTFMPPSTSTRSPKTTKKVHSLSRSVLFKEVIHAMNGKLFPPDSSERADDARRIVGLPIANTTPHRRMAAMRAELLDSLLQVVEWQDGERRKAKGKQVDRAHQSLKHVRPPTPIPSVPASLSVPSSSSSPSLATSRSSSWLSFGSWRSTATDITAPDSPVVGSPASSQHCLLPTVIEDYRDLYPRCSLVRISVEESPLCPPTTPHHRPTVNDDLPSCPPSPETLDIRLALLKHVTRSVISIVEAAKGLQSAYIAAAMFSAGPSHSHSVSALPPHNLARCQRQLRPDGYRAVAKDVQLFADSATSTTQTSEPVHFIPLVPLPSATPGLLKPAVPKNAIIFPSPLRPRTPPAVLAYRMRPVANPAVLRLKALQNLMYARGKEWEGRAREGGLGCGKERMLGVAFEGRGRSGLGCEVRFVVA